MTPCDTYIFNIFHEDYNLLYQKEINEKEKGGERELCEVVLLSWAAKPQHNHPLTHPLQRERGRK